MKRAISNIGWDNSVQLSAIADLLHAHGIEGIECAPLKMKHDCGLASDDFKSMKDVYKSYGFEIPAFQAIVFGHPELQVFDPSSHKAFIKHLKQVASWAELCGTRTLVFGAPKNKWHNSTLLDGALEVACSFFREAGSAVSSYGCKIAVEANPKQYGCNFLTSTSEARRFVELVGSPAVELHIDTGTCILNGEDTHACARAGGFGHVHLSAPFLDNIAQCQFDYGEFASEISPEYQGWLSIEMSKCSSGVDYHSYIEKALEKAFGGTHG